MSGKKTNERIEKQLEITLLEQQIDSLYGKIERKKEEFKILNVYREFVFELSSSNDNNKSSTFVTQNLEDLYTPTYLLNSINSLERKNLFLIQQAQEAEQNLENLKSKGKIEEKHYDYQNNAIKLNIKNLEKQKEFITTKITGISNEKAEKPLVSEETLKLIHESLADIYNILGCDIATSPSDFEILEHLENSIRAEIEKSKLLGEEVLKKREKEIDKFRRKQNVETLKLKEIEKAKEISETLSRRKKFVNKKAGRRKMERSKIPEKVEEQEKIVIPQEILDKREFLEEYFPYP